jgi:hypothetical protein
MSQKLAIVIDIDGTIIGDIVPQVIEYDILNKYNKNGIRYFKKFLTDLLKTELIRPGLVSFIQNISKENNNVHFFIFTASDHKWANFLVPCIEAALNIKFSRPIFTRKHMSYCKKTGSYRKSLKTILPQISKSVKCQINLKNCIMIDNNDTLVSDESKRLILCPTYEYVLYQDPLKFVPASVLKHNLQSIIMILKYVPFFENLKQNTEINLFYANFYNIISKMHTINCSKEDKLWKTLEDLIIKYLKLKNRNEFKDSLTFKINQKISR